MQDNEPDLVPPDDDRLPFRCSAMCALSLPGTDRRAPESRQPKAPHDLLRKMSPGWNMGNTLEAIPNETAWGNPIASS